MPATGITRPHEIGDIGVRPYIPHLSGNSVLVFAAAGYRNIDRPEICAMLHTIRNNIKGGDLVSTEILEKGAKTIGDTEV